MDRSVTTLTRELRRLGVDTKTPGIKADARRDVLEKRYAKHKVETEPGFVPPPPLSRPSMNNVGLRVPPPPSSSLDGRSTRVPPPPRAAAFAAADAARQGWADAGFPAAKLRGQVLPPSALGKARHGGPAADGRGGAIVARQPTGFGEAATQSTRRILPRGGPPPPSGLMPAENTAAQFGATATSKADSTPLVDESFSCNKCGKSFKKVAHLIVHSRTHKGNATATSAASAPAAAAAAEDAPKDTQWIEEFAKGLYNLARTEGMLERTGSGLHLHERGAPPLERRSTIANHVQREPSEAQRWFGRGGRIPPPPEGPPPSAVLLRAKSMPALKGITGGGPALAAQSSEDQEEIARTEARAKSLRTEIAEMKGRKESALRARLQENKDIDMQEIEWELEQVQLELRRVESHEGLFIDSRVASSSGRVQRWAKEDLAKKLIQLESELTYRLRVEVGKVRAEEDKHPEYGSEAQRVRESELAKLEARVGDMRQRSTRRQTTLHGRFAGATTRSIADGTGLGPADAARQAAHQALMLHAKRRDAAEAERLYRRAVEELKCEDATVLGNFALFLSERWSAEATQEACWSALGSDERPQSPTLRGRNDEADRLFRAAIRRDPMHANNLANYATFLKNNLKDYDRAEQYFERSCRANPRSAATVGNYANFLFKVRKDVGRAERMFQRALDVGPDHVNNMCNYASLLKKLGKASQAEALYRRALQAQPRNATVLSNYANMLAKRCSPDDTSPEALQCLHKTQELYLQALSADPAHRTARRNYMLFLRDFPAIRAKQNERVIVDARLRARAGEAGGRGRPRSPGQVRRPRSRSPHSGGARPLSPPLIRVIE